MLDTYNNNECDSDYAAALERVSKLFGVRGRIYKHTDTDDEKLVYVVDEWVQGVNYSGRLLRGSGASWGEAIAIAKDFALEREIFRAKHNLRGDDDEHALTLDPPVEYTPTCRRGLEDTAVYIILGCRKAGAHLVQEWLTFNKNTKLDFEFFRWNAIFRLGNKMLSVYLSVESGSNGLVLIDQEWRNAHGVVRYINEWNIAKKFAEHATEEIAS